MHALLFFLPWIDSCTTTRVGGRSPAHTYAFYLLFYHGPGATACTLREEEDDDEYGVRWLCRCWCCCCCCCLHASYSRREAAVLRFDAPTWPNWKKPVSSSRSSFFACILAFCAASTTSTSLTFFPFYTVLFYSLVSFSSSSSSSLSLPPSLFISLSFLLIRSFFLCSCIFLSLTLLREQTQRGRILEGLYDSHDQIHFCWREVIRVRPLSDCYSILNSILPDPIPNTKNLLGYVCFASEFVTFEIKLPYRYRNNNTDETDQFAHVLSFYLSTFQSYRKAYRNKRREYATVINIMGMISCIIWVIFMFNDIFNILL